jgi:hypothetical protein
MKAVLTDIKRQKVSVEQLYILGDAIGLRSDSDRVIQSIRNPR